MFSNIKAVGVSAASGEGIHKLFTSIDESAVEFNETYLPDLLRYVGCCIAVVVVVI